MRKLGLESKLKQYRVNKKINFKIYLTTKILILVIINRNGQFIAKKMMTQIIPLKINLENLLLRMTL